jgi:hypothetical protein
MIPHHVSNETTRDTRHCIEAIRPMRADAAPESGAS